MSIKEQIADRIRELDNEADAKLGVGSTLKQAQEQCEYLGEIKGLRWVLHKLEQ